MSISAKQVAELRQQSGAGMMDCKKALVETGGDMAKGVDIFRRKISPLPISVRIRLLRTVPSHHTFTTVESVYSLR